MADPLIQSLLDGNVIGFVVACYTSVMGQYFYGMLLLIFFGGLYNETRSIPLCAILWLLLGGSWIIVASVVSPIAMLLVAFGLTGILYSVFGKRS